MRSSFLYNTVAIKVAKINIRKKNAFMNKNLTEVVFILDRSGSMSGLERDTIGGFNSMLEKQKIEKGRVLISTVLFDNEIEVLHDRILLEDVKPMTDKDYYVRGSTALLDAVGETIKRIKTIQKYARDEDKPAHTLFIITTDGEENSSRHYDYDEIKEVVERQKELFDWEFIFTGANIDAVSTASKIGISSDRAVNYICDAKGIEQNFDCYYDCMSIFSSDEALPADCLADISDDYEFRK